MKRRQKNSLTFRYMYITRNNCTIGQLCSYNIQHWDYGCSRQGYFSSITKVQNANTGICERNGLFSTVVFQYSFIVFFNIDHRINRMGVAAAQ